MNLNTRGALRRTALGAVAGATALLTLAAPAGAGAPTRVNAEYWGVSCVADLGGGQTLFLFGGGTTDGAEGGIGAFVEDADGAQVAEGQATDFGFGPTFHATIPLGSKAFSISATATAGPTVTEQVNDRDGNSWTKGSTSHADVTLSGGTASYGGKAVTLAENACNGEINGFHVRTTNPSASIHTSSDFASDICDLDGLADGQVRLTGVLPTPYVEVVLDHGGENVEKAQGELRVNGGRGTLRTDFLDVFTGAVRTHASIGLGLTKAGKTVRETLSEDGTTQRQSVTPYRAEVSVATADGRRGTTSCSAVSVTTQIRVKPAH
ncbi:hypothetical protein [Nocardioides marmorisolisilvae]|uniref:Uncharacterized protein n=1 Tax=Nocardioides marmorisolisilvae TaxID=1542737 RepID=A0A3N0DZ76_9ACTN|nr:hypothetical protein [Nocardioides marmorisolisilvae]RNL80915.1 hypothetical protein EFL95_00560 [Nocardioides marmorisolisilvae]